ncbi:MAG: NAD-dependent DNA ligase LigA [Oscillospiraceae bacterium]|nr:NAD-dependent DNA ligase LigA [Oscillospiraceae bacterium]
MDKKQRIEALVSILNKASENYYGGREESMPNYEWDAMFDELSKLEAETGYILTNSPTQTTSYAVSEISTENGSKEAHEFTALSLAKTKDIRDLQTWAGNLTIWISWKLDGLTLVLTYDKGVLAKILTRGNGTIGTNISFMKNAIKGIPQKIEYKGHFVVRGEATISYADFEAINDILEDDDEKYANPRNLASGTLSLDVSKLDLVRERKITFNAFTLVYIDEPMKSWGQRMAYLDALGFTTVEREETIAADLPSVVDKWTKKVESGQMGLPVDGLVVCYDDTDYAATGTVTGHHATRAGFAFKWQDVSAISLLDHIEWSCAASTITPVAVFEPVQLEGTTVSRASLCNISEMERLGIGEDHRTTLEIIKANKIIPKCIAVKKAEGTFTIPSECPVCHAQTYIKIRPKSEIKTLHCTNSTCPAKHLKRFARFVSKQGMDIDGLSIQSLLVFINKGFIAKFEDIYHLSEHVNEIKRLDGFADKSCDNLIKAIERSRKVHPVNFIYSLCIPLIGIDAAKRIIRKLGYNGFLNRLDNSEGYEDIEGIGPEKSTAILKWYQNSENKDSFLALLKELSVEAVSAKESSAGRCSGLTFVITGDVQHFDNRDSFKAYVEAQGGTVTGSISNKTNYLVNNDLNSTSSKNMKAKALGIPIISEDDFINTFGENP